MFYVLSRITCERAARTMSSAYVKLILEPNSRFEVSDLDPGSSRCNDTAPAAPLTPALPTPKFEAYPEKRGLPAAAASVRSRRVACTAYAAKYTRVYLPVHDYEQQVISLSGLSG